MNNPYNDELEIKKQAIQKIFQGNRKLQDISHSFGKSRFWLHYWYEQYLKYGFDGLKKKQRGWQKNQPRRFSQQLIAEIVNIRQRLEENPQEYFYGAQRIYQEFVNLGYNKEQIPSIAYIKKVLSQRGCVKSTRLKNYVPLKGYPESFIENLGLTCQLDFIGYKRIHDYHWPIHFLALAYKELKYGHIWRIKAEKSSIITPLLFDYWQDNPKPQIAQMDNDWPFIGSGSAKGTISHMARFLLSLGVTPLFIPESSPWRNGIIEGANSVFGRKFWQRHEFKNPSHIDKELTVYNHKLKEYKLKTFNIDLSRYKTISKKRSFSKRLITGYRFKVSDTVYFIRLCRLYGRLNGIKLLNCTFTVAPEFLNHYVLAKLNIVEQTVNLYQEIDDGKLVEIKKSKIKLKL